jgi:hypothetical protein
VVLPRLPVYRRPLIVIVIVIVAMTVIATVVVIIVMRPVIVGLTNANVNANEHGNWSWNVNVSVNVSVATIVIVGPIPTADLWIAQMIVLDPRMTTVVAHHMTTDAWTATRLVMLTDAAQRHRMITVAWMTGIACPHHRRIVTMIV